jgi:hypothetical protein
MHHQITKQSNHQITKLPNHQTTKQTAFPTFNIQLSTFNSEAESFLLIRNTHYQISTLAHQQINIMAEKPDILSQGLPLVDK